MHDEQSSASMALMKIEEPAWKLAPSLEDAQVGEVMMLDQHGRVLSPGRIRWLWLRSWLTAGSMGAALGVTASLLLGSAVWGGAAAVAYGGILVWQMRHRSALRRVLALCAAGKRDEARAALDHLKSQRMPAQYTPVLDMLTGNLAFLQGDFEEALAYYERVIDQHRPIDHSRAHPIYWICAFNRVQLLAASGQLDRARSLRPELDSAPSGEYFAMDRMLTDLLLAFHLGNVAMLDGDLYDWAKAALKTNRFGLNVVLLSWAFSQRGDREMARHLLREAPQRLTGHFLQDSAPKVHAWMEEKKIEWNITGDDELDDFQLPG